MKPRTWKKGEPLSSVRLNDGNTEAARSRRQFTLGTGSSMVNETMGNQSSQSHETGTRLVVATEDFAIVNVPTDVYALNDPQYHGLCKMMRLNSGSATPNGLYEQEIHSKEFRVWDPIALLANTPSKSMGDVFYSVYNKDSKRWEVLQGSSTGSLRIWFEIISVECVSPTEMILTVLPTYYTGGCTAPIPGEDSYGYVIVEDICGTLLYYTQAYLEAGVTGAATYMYPRTGYCTPLWLLDSICGMPDCA